MTVEMVTPQECVASIVSDLNARRGVVSSQNTAAGTVIVSATVPLENMFGYASTLGAISQGRASYTMQFREYRPVPRLDDDPPFPPAIGMRA